MDQDVQVDISGEMNVPPPQQKTGFDCSSLKQFQGIPTPFEVLQWIRQLMRPWNEFLSTANFKYAASMPRLTSRFVRNLKHFQANYICVFFILMIYCLVTSPLILFVLSAVAFASYKIRSAQAPVCLFGYQLMPNHQILAVNIASIPVLFIVGAGAALFWTLGASCFVIGLHAIFYNIDAIVTEEAESFLSEVV